jgi:hypothetical protein
MYTTFILAVGGVFWRVERSDATGARGGYRQQQEKFCPESSSLEVTWMRMRCSTASASIAAAVLMSPTLGVGVGQVDATRQSPSSMGNFE